MTKHDPGSHAEIRAKILGGNATPSPSRDRTRMVASGNPDVLREAADLDRSGVGQSKLKPGPAWHEGLRARPVDHHPGKQDTPDIGRGPVITK
jgi:hypothetical protein